MPDATIDSLSLLRQDIAAGFKHDDRIRALEIEQAETKALLAEIPKMEKRLVDAIRENRPRSPWPAVSALAGVAGVLLVLAAAIYSR
ncbi:hypothetical protein JCM18899A_18890 [Nocardioides sp. AN3]